MRRLVACLAIPLIASTLVSACASAPTSTPELQAVVQAKAPRGVSAEVWKTVQAFYAARELKLAWMVADGPTPRAQSAVDALRAAEIHGLDPAQYGESDLRSALSALQRDDDSPERAQAIADFDVRLTAALLQLGGHVATGRLSPRTIDPRWNARRSPPDYAAFLQQAYDDDNVAGFFDLVQPKHPEYRRLREMLAALRGRSDGPQVSHAPLKIGQWNPAVAQLRQRLAALGYLDTAADDSAHYDARVQAAVKAFQEHHALPASGVLDRATLSKLNVPVGQRLRQVAMNLERWRWLPDDLGGRHFLVNVPDFHLFARENGDVVLDMRVVVGKRGNETPLFSDEMETVVFSPYWNVPDTIAMEETAPAVARDPEFLARNNMEVVNAAGKVVDEEEIPWGDEAALAAYRFRQRPGADNALGYVKFLFPNKHSVYLHDTPADALFKRIGRAFSHGCVRVEEPEVLAQYVLRDQPEWTSDAIHAAMRAGDERHVRLRQTIPVHIVYLTAWVDERGGLHFEDDVYGYDARQASR